ncbi:hypothetical protein [Rheinheimera nanhaiensis]|uniref:DUF1240 domain-containing protein n=1 Tax=Rheinheimera nanhaiensis E407-8 TaxID=562729 RepID=I1DW45_9GAMM|nr:hypothetical protein [Rheinheimera nanhaiensis]GAB58273.1 hypothetical protein RNAN_1244 [Rheinheimera nanhaiensis E407-8]
MPQQTEDFERKKGLAVFLSFVMLAMTAGYCWMAFDSIEQIMYIEQRQFYFRISMYGLPGLFALPIFLMITYALLARHFSTLQEKHFKFGVKLSLWLLGLALLARVAFGFVLPGYLQQHGFSYCAELTGAALHANDVWVSNEEYCHPLSYLVRGDLLDWFDEQQAAGAKPSNDEVIAKIELLIAQYKQRYQ